MKIIHVKMPKSFLNIDVIMPYTKHISHNAVVWDVTVCTLIDKFRWSL